MPRASATRHACCPAAPPKQHSVARVMSWPRCVEMRLMARAMVSQATRMKSSASCSGAGGGSVCAFEDGRYRVGPRSAGADPGPACYGKGGPLAVTDCNVVVGKLQPWFFPRVFGADGAESIDAEAAREALAAVAASMRAAGLDPPAPEQLADDFIRVACDTMARAIKRISTQRGHDITRATLCCFGGAAGQHACLVADALGMDSVLLHPLAGVLSAYGMGLADVRALRERTLETPLSEAAAGGAAALDELEAAALAELVAQGFAAADVHLAR